MNLKIFSLLLAVSISLVFAGPACKIEIRNETPHRLVNRGLSSHQVCILIQYIVIIGNLLKEKRIFFIQILQLTIIPFFLTLDRWQNGTFLR